MTELSGYEELMDLGTDSSKSRTKFVRPEDYNDNSDRNADWILTKLGRIKLPVYIVLLECVCYYNKYEMKIEAAT